jgi:Domain of unknown function (DUF4249)
MQKTTILFIILSIFLACEEPIDVPNKNNVNLFSISAVIVDTLNGPPIRLSKSALGSSLDLSSLTTVSEAKVQIIENNQSVFLFSEDANIKGSYNPPSNFFAKTDSKYVLKIVLKDGATYISEQEAMPSTSIQINNLAKKFKVIFSMDYNNYGFIPSHSLFLTIADDPNSENYYQVTYKQYEEEDYCNLSPSTPPLLTGCRYMCWTKIESNKLVVFTDRLANGKEIENINIGDIRYNLPYPPLVQVSLLGITKSSYNYLKITQDQVEKQGSLADTPPVAYIGNISLTSPTGFQPVGYFMVAKQKQNNYLLERNEPELAQYDPYFVAIRRNIGLSIIPCVFSKSAPCYCKENETTTSKLPEGWPLPTKRVLQPDI